MLTKTSTELAQFFEFSRWLRHEIDIQTAEPMSQTLSELQEKSDEIDHAVVLEYIQCALTNSALRLFITSTPSPPTGQKKWWDFGEERQGSFYETYRHALSLQAKEDQQLDEKEDSQENLPKLNNLIDRLTSQSYKVFKQIALTQKRSILHHSLLELHPDCDQDVVDTTMQYEIANGKEMFFIYAASRLQNSPHTCKMKSPRQFQVVFANLASAYIPRCT
jgi:anaphase-promoting complex subunit 4